MNANVIKAVVHGVIQRGITQVELKDNGHLVFTLSDGKILDLGNVVGRGIEGITRTNSVTGPGITDVYTIVYTDGESQSLSIYNGKDGKSAYQYARDGGYTGTETEFAEKQSQEMPTKLPNPKSLTFTGAASGTYDGSQEITVNIPIGGGSVDLDTTLSVSGKAADAKAAGDALAEKLSKAGGTMTGNLSMGGKNISGAAIVHSYKYNVGDNCVVERATNYAGSYGKVPLRIVTDNGDYELVFGGGKIGRLTATPSNNDDAANKKYVDDVATGKLNTNQGAANAGKYLGIGSDGAVAPVAAPAGGGSGESDWRLIQDITVEANVKSVSVNSDYNGAGFSCREIYILSNAVNKSDQTSATYLKLAFNGQSKYDGNSNQHPYATFGKTGESGRNWFWVKSINPLILLHGNWNTQNTTQGKNVYCIQQHINDAVPNPFAEGEKIESIEISGGLSSSYIASGSRILIYGR